VISFAGPKTTPAVAAEPGRGERNNTSTLLPTLEVLQEGLPRSTSLLARQMLPPFVGSPSVAYHWRSTTVSGTPVLLHAKVTPPSSEPAVPKFARLRSAK
jgi:hypothetical protein